MTDTEHLRLLICKDCKTIEPLPDFDGVGADHLLEYLVAPHRTNGLEHIGMLARVEANDWNNFDKQREIVNQLTAKFGGETGLGQEFYDTRDTFKYDALMCFKQHNRNPDCNDYHSDAKRLTPDTADARREAGLDPYRSQRDRYLCDFCPVQSMVEQKYYDNKLKKRRGKK